MRDCPGVWQGEVRSMSCCRSTGSRPTSSRSTFVKLFRNVIEDRGRSPLILALANLFQPVESFGPRGAECICLFAGLNSCVIDQKAGLSLSLVLKLHVNL